MTIAWPGCCPEKTMWKTAGPGLELSEVTSQVMNLGLVRLCHQSLVSFLVHGSNLITCWTACHSLFLNYGMYCLCPNCPVEFGSVIECFIPFMQLSDRGTQTMQHKQCIISLCEFVNFHQNITCEPTISAWNIRNVGQNVGCEKIIIVFSLICTWNKKLNFLQKGIFATHHV